MPYKISHILKLICPLLIFSFSFLISTAQWYDPDKVNKKAGEIYGRAYEAATAADYTGALKLLQEALA
jgi:hypothetical protein